MKTILLALYILLLLTPMGIAQPGYRIEVRIQGLRDTSIYLGYHFGARKFAVDTAWVNAQGVAVFERDSLLPGGIYLIITPDRSFFDVLLADDQRFSLTTTMENPLENLRFSGSAENTAFADYLRFMSAQQQRMTEVRTQMEAEGEGSPAAEALAERMNQLDREVNEYWDRLIERHRGTFLATLVQSLRPVPTPEFTIPEGTANPDSLRWVLAYQHNKRNFFHNIDLTDERLLRTPFFQGRVDAFFDRALLQIPDTIIRYAVEVIERTRANPRMYQFMLSHLVHKYQQSNIMGMDAVFVHLADRYYLSGLAPWASADLIARIRERVEAIRPNLIGQVAPNVRLFDPLGHVVELHALEAQALVIYFWDPDCSHCLRVTPELFRVYEQFRERGVKVVAVYTQTDAQEWVEHLEKNNLTWVNVWDPTRSSQYHKLYDIFSTPVIYVLDRDMTIVAKRIGVESVGRILEEIL